MNKKKYKACDTEIEKCKFHQYERPISIDSIDIDKIVVSNKISFGKKDFKYFVGNKEARKVRTLCIFFPKMSAFRRRTDEIKYVSFLIKLLEFLGKYNVIWKKGGDIKKEFDSEPVYNEKYLKTKSTQIFTLIKYEKKALIVFAYQ